MKPRLNFFLFRRVYVNFISCFHIFLLFAIQLFHKVDFVQKTFEKTFGLEWTIEKGQEYFMHNWTIEK